MATKKLTPTTAPAAPGKETREALAAIAAEARHGDVRKAVADLADLLAGK